MPWSCAACGGSNVAGTRFCGHCGAQGDQDAGHGRGRTAEGGPHRGRPGRPRVPVAEAGRAAERRLVTVVFADLSGFTALAESLDPEQLLEVMEPLLTRMRDTVVNYDGYVAHFAGDAVLAFFGAPTAHEDDALRALLAARDMRAEVAELGAQLAPGFGLQLHIGVNTGHVVAGHGSEFGQFDYSVLGDAVNVAQRLEAAAQGGEIYVGQLTRDLTMDHATFADVGLLTVKGKSTTVHAWRLMDTASASARAAPTERAVNVAGRDRQRAIVAQRLQEAAAGSAQVIAIVGEPGAGKSRLLEALRADASGQGLRWLGAACASYGANLPYRPFVGLLHAVAGVTADAATGTVRDGLAAETERLGVTEHLPYLLHVLGATAAAEVPADVLANPQAMQRRIQDALLSLLLAIASDQPLVLAIEDLHWSDRASLDMTRSLVAGASGARLAVVATLRPEGVELLAQISSGAGGRTELELPRLDRDSVRSVISDVVDGAVSDDLLDFVNRHADGNPLFAQQIVRSLQDHGELSGGPEGWRLRRRSAEVVVPPAVEAVLASRIDVLPALAAEVLQIAAVVGREVPLPLLADVCGRDPQTLDADLTALEDRGLVHRGINGSQERLTFHHPLVVTIAYARLLRRRRREIHRAVVSSAVRLYGAGDDLIDLLAHHAYLGDMGRDALPYLTAAAKRAASLFANHEALTHLTHALDIIGDSDEAAELWLERADLHRRIGEFNDALTCYRRAAAWDAATAAIGSAQTLRRLGRHQELVSLVERTMQSPGLSPEQRAALAHERATSLGHTNVASAAIEGFEAALAEVEGTGSPWEAEICLSLGRQLLLVDRDQEALSYCERGVRLLEASGDLASMPKALVTLAAAQNEIAAGDRAGLQLAEATLLRARSVADQVGDAEFQAAALVNLGRTQLQLDRPEEAVASFRQALSAFELIDLKAGIAAAYCNLAEALFALGRIDDAAQAASAGLAVAEELGHTFWITGGLLGLCAAHSARGNYHLLQQCAERAASVARESGLVDRLSSAEEWLADAHAHLRPGSGG